MGGPYNHCLSVLWWGLEHAAGPVIVPVLELLLNLMCALQYFYDAFVCYCNLIGLSCSDLHIADGLELEFSMIYCALHVQLDCNT